MTISEKVEIAVTTDTNPELMHYRETFHAAGKYNGLHLAGNIIEQAMSGKKISRKKLERALAEIRKLELEERERRNRLENAIIELVTLRDPHHLLPIGG